MPNWCQGNIRLRGKSEDVMAFLFNELEGSSYTDNLATKSSPLRYEYDDILDTLTILPPDEGVYRAIYIKGTRRNFIDKGFDVEFDMDESGVSRVCIDNFSAAWDIDPEPYVEFSRKYHIDIRILGFEQGMQFGRTIEILDGKLLEDEKLKYDDWFWDCPFPNLGG